MLFAPFQLSLNRCPYKIGAVFPVIQHRLDPVESAPWKPGLHIFGPHLFSSHGDYFSYEVLTTPNISNMSYS